MKNDNHATIGFTFIDALQVLFIGLKLMRYIDWPWVVVLLPIIVHFGILLVAFFLLGVVAYIEMRK